MNKLLVNKFKNFQECLKFCLKIISFQILFSAIVLAGAKPSSDYSDPSSLDESNVSASSSASDENEENPNLNANHPIGIYTKYQDSPENTYEVPDLAEVPQDDDLRVKRGFEQNGTFPFTNSTGSVTNSTQDEKVVEPTKLPLRGLITAIESDLVVRAQEINAHLRKRRSTPDTDNDAANSSDTSTITNDSEDVNKDFFGGLFNFTRPLRETEDKDIKIQLGGLVNAVETTLVNSARNLKDSNPAKRDTSTEKNSDSNESHRIDRDCNSDVEQPNKPNIQVQALSASNSLQNLNLLGPITFKPAVAAVEEVTSSEENDISTTNTPIVQKTNLTVIEKSKATSLVPGSDNKLAHVQHQQISKTVFLSNLAIFPTIPPTSINAPLLQITTTEQPEVETTVAIQSTTAAKLSEQELKHQQLIQKAQELKEKFAEVQADPIILSQF